MTTGDALDAGGLPSTGDAGGLPSTGDAGGLPSTGDAFDAGRLLAEIDAEVRRRRASGELDPEFERDLDRQFALLAPVDAVDGDFDAVVAKIEASTVIDTRAPTDSARPGVPQIKGVVAKAIGWYVRHTASQVSGLAHATVKALRLLGDRVDRLERAAPDAGRSTLDRLGTGASPALPVAGASPALPVAGASPALPVAGASPALPVAGASPALPVAGASPALPVAGASPALCDAWEDRIASAVAGAPGRVLHAACADGALVAALCRRGLDAYGVDPSEWSALAGADRALDIRADDPAAHLRALAPGTLGAVVLSGLVERDTTGDRLALVDLVASRLAPGGVVAVVSLDPEAWGVGATVVQADLSGGRPWHAETWEAVLVDRGLAGVSVQRESGPVSYAVTARLP